MVWNRFKLPRFALPRLPVRRPSRDLVKKTVIATLLAVGLIGAFYWGRHGALNDARAQGPQSGFDVQQLVKASQGQQHNRDIVAYIYGTVPITRQELGEYLIERFGAERVEFLVNRKIIELACQAQKIFISDAEIKAQLEEDLKSFGVSERDFVNNILRKYNKSMLEWKEDVIRPKLALQRYVKQRIVISEDDIQKAFEAKYSEKVECLIVVLAKEQDKYSIWTKISANRAEFDNYAKEQFIKPLAAEGGKIPPIHKHFGDKNIELEAFKLQPGEISPLIGMPDGTTVILKCKNRLPADTTKRLDQERLALHKEIAEVRLELEIKTVFAKMREQAAPQIFLKREYVPPAETTASARQPHLVMPAVQTAQQPEPPQPESTLERQLPPSPPVVKAPVPPAGN